MLLKRVIKPAHSKLQMSATPWRSNCDWRKASPLEAFFSQKRFSDLGDENANVSEVRQLS